MTELKTIVTLRQVLEKVCGGVQVALGGEMLHDAAVGNSWVSGIKDEGRVGPGVIVAW